MGKGSNELTPLSTTKQNPSVSKLEIEVYSASDYSGCGHLFFSPQF